MSKRGNNEGSLTHRKDGRWEASVSLGGGKRRRFYAATRQEASRKLNEALRARADRLPLLTDRLTVGAYLSNWLVGVKPTLRPGTWERYRQYVELHAIPVIGGIPLVRLAPEHLEKLYADRLEAGLSPTTVGHLHAVCHRAFGEAARRGQMLRNPVDLVKRPRATRREMMALSPEQARAFLDAARGDRYEGLYVLALTSGARQGELLALRWDAVNLDAATLTVRATLRRTRDGFVFGEPKTARSRRQIALTAVAVAALRRHRARQLAERLAQPYWQDETLVFASEVGTPLEATNLIRRSFKPLLRKANVPDLRFHDLRHSFASLMLAQNVNVKVISAALGHSQIGITLDLYSHITPTMERQAVEALDAVLGG